MKCSCCSSPVKPVAVFDIDGTLARYHETVQDFASIYFDRLPIPYPYRGDMPFRDHLELTQTEHRAMKLAYRQGGNKRFVKPYFGATAVVNTVRNFGVEIWVATTRPFNRLDNIDPDTVEWLRRNGIVIDGLLFGEDKYQQLIDTIDRERIVAAFEDLPEQILIGQSFGLPMYHVYRQHNESIRYVGGSLTDGVEFARTQIERWRRDHE